MTSGSPDVGVVSIGSETSKKEWKPFQSFTAAETPSFAEGAERSDILLGLRLGTRGANIYEETPLSTENSTLKRISKHRIRASKKRAALNARERMARKNTNTLYASERKRRQDACSKGNPFFQRNVTQPYTLYCDFLTNKRNRLWENRMGQ